MDLQVLLLMAPAFEAPLSADRSIRIVFNVFSPSFFVVRRDPCILAGARTVAKVG